MKESFSISIPGDVDKKDIDALAEKLQSIDKVTAARTIVTRGLDVQIIAVWVDMLSEIIGVAGLAVPFIQKIIKAIRGKGVTGVKIKLPNGVEISVDNASSDEITKLLEKVSTK